MSRFQSPASARVFMFDFLFCCCCVSTFFVQNTLFIAQFCNSFYNVILFSILNILQDLWPIIRVERYRPSIFKHVWHFKGLTWVILRTGRTTVFLYFRYLYCNGGKSWTWLDTSENLTRYNTGTRRETIKKCLYVNAHLAKRFPYFTSDKKTGERVCSKLKYLRNEPLLKV